MIGPKANEVDVNLKRNSDVLLINGYEICQKTDPFHIDNLELRYYENTCKIETTFEREQDIEQI